ncbi:MAG: hypothetical protein JWP75_2979 [Frondihabitans sp.]|nr:hypothetical protein [Frondihabitans sp.]
MSSTEPEPISRDRAMHATSASLVTAPAVLSLSAALMAVDASHRNLRALFASSVGLSATEFNALMYIGEMGSTTPKQLAITLDVSTGAVTALTDRLAAATLVLREPNPNDRRSLLLRLTPMGARARQSMSDQYHAAISRAVDETPELTDPQLQELLTRVAAAVTAIADAIAATSVVHPKR